MAAKGIRRDWSRLVVVLSVVGLMGQALAEQSKVAVPSNKEELAKSLREKPITADTWAFWRERYVQWYYDRSGVTRELDEQLAHFVGQQFNAKDQMLPAPFADDPYAWQLLGRFHMRDKTAERSGQRLEAAESAFRRSIRIQPGISATHSSLAIVLVSQIMAARSAMSESEKHERWVEAEREIARAAELSTEFRPAYVRGLIAMSRDQFTEAERCLRQAMQDFPNNEFMAVLYLRSVLAGDDSRGKKSETSSQLTERFAECGELRAMHAVAQFGDGKFAEAAESLARARQLGADPQKVLGQPIVDEIQKLAAIATPPLQQAFLAMEAKNYAAAERLFEQALGARPDAVEVARHLAVAMLAHQGSDASGGKAADRLRELCDRFPEDGTLRTYHALALAKEERLRESAAALDKAETLGAKPSDLVGDEPVQQIRELSRPSVPLQFLKVMGWFAAAYAVVMALMAGAGALLAVIAPRVPNLPASFKFGTAEVFVSGRESWLGRVYIFVLIVGLLLFYVSVPFVTAGLAAATGAVLYLFFLLPHIPVKLLFVVGAVGLGMVWSVLKSVLASHGRGAFGLRKTPQDYPRLFAAIHDVANRTETSAMDEVYVAPGSEIGVHQDGRGPFGMFGVKRRVLTLGLSTMSSLTVSELKAILAHEYAHFSHRDTLYSRFIHQVTLSISQALSGMAAAGGNLNYLNPFFWFFWLYHKAYTILASGFSRSREFLADRMAVSLYGKEAFISALRKVATEGSLFEGTIFPNVVSLLAEGKAFENMYSAFRGFRDEQLSPESLGIIQEVLLKEKPSLLATHPTFPERMRALAAFPDLPPRETQSAIELFDDPDAIEKELTEFFTGYAAAVQRMRARAAANH